MTDEIPAPAIALSATDAEAAAPAPAVETDIAKPKISLAEIAETRAAAASVVEAPSAAAAEAAAPPRGNRFALLAASVALTAGVGALAGALGASGLTRGTPVAEQGMIAAAAHEKTDALQSAIGRMQTELAALRTSVEAVTRATNGQFSKISERFDRVERTQTERATKFIKAVESLERLDRRADATPARETTGSVPMPAPQPVSATPAQSQPPLSPQVAQPAIVEGWVVRNVYRGTAIIQNRRLGTVDVEPGDVLPGVGRVEAIKKQDGKWVVVTAKGLITTR
jgi:hypothetical protein